MSGKQATTLLIVVAVSLAAGVWWQRRQEAAQQLRVYNSNVAAVDHFKKYGGGF